MGLNCLAMEIFFSHFHFQWKDSAEKGGDKKKKNTVAHVDHNFKRFSIFKQEKNKKHR